MSNLRYAKELCESTNRQDREYGQYLVRHFEKYGDCPKFSNTTLRDSYYHKNLKCLGFAKILYETGIYEVLAYHNLDTNEIFEWDGKEFGTIIKLDCTLEMWNKYKQPMSFMTYMYS